jgi:myosin light chain 6
MSVGTQISFTEDQIADFQEAFLLFDTRGDGMIPSNQVGEVIRVLGQNPTEADVKRLQGQSQNADGRVSFDTFLPILQAVSQKPVTDTVEDFVEGMRHFDKDGNGFISSAELRHMLTHLGEKMTEEDVESLIHGQEDNDGNVNYENFVKMVITN